MLQLLLKGCSERGAKRIRLHILTDGRDVLDGSSVGFVETLEKELAELREKGVDAQIASGGGRMYVTMDRYEVGMLFSDGILHFLLSLSLSASFIDFLSPTPSPPSLKREKRKRIYGVPFLLKY